MLTTSVDRDGPAGKPEDTRGHRRLAVAFVTHAAQCVREMNDAGVTTYRAALAGATLEGLPPGFPAVRAANPAALDAPPGLDGVEAVLVRLLGGRRAWEEGFGRLRRDCVEQDVPLLARSAAPDGRWSVLLPVSSSFLFYVFVVFRVISR